MPELKAFVKEKGYAKETEDYQHRAQSWKDTYLMAKDVYALDPETVPNTYLKYYLLQDEVVEHSNKEYTRANEVMDSREKEVFDTAKGIIEKVVRKDILLQSEHMQHLLSIWHAHLHLIQKKECF